MKKTIVLPIIITLFMLLSSTVISLPLNEQKNITRECESIQLSYQFSSPIISTIEVNNTYYSRVTIESLATMDDPGAPQLPVKGAYILLPPDTKIKDIFMNSLPKQSIQLMNPIIPSSIPIPRDAQVPYLGISLEKDNEIYKDDQPYPLETYTNMHCYTMKGYRILILQLHPIRYYPLQDSIEYYPILNLTITVEPEQQNDHIRSTIDDKEIIKNKVDNPDMMEKYQQKIQVSTSEPYDLLILTHQSLKQGFQNLKQYHDNQGLYTKIVTIDEINPFISSGDTPEDMRAFIKNEYENSGIQYVLLGGDTDLVPSKILYVQGMDEDKYYLDTTLPADFYFSCLDGTFNFDNDDKWGEKTDGEGGSDVDLLSEVFVGRAACDDLEDVNRFVQKTILYDSLDPDDPDLKKVLMIGEQLGDYGVASWGGNYLDLLLNESDADDYSTQGIPSLVYDIHKLYDRDHPQQYWPPEDLFSYINDNIHIINHDGHSSYGYNMKLVNYQVLEMENTIPFFTYSVGCMAGGFDNPNDYDCFAEYLTVKADNAAFSAIMNARYGFFWSYSTDGDGTRYTREFWDAVFGEHIPCISMAHQDSQEDNIHLIDRSCMRWTFYGLNYFGDPSISFNIGHEPSQPIVSGPSQIKPGDTAQFSIYSTDVDSDELRYCIMWGDGNSSDWIGPYSNGEIVEISHVWMTKGDYEIKVKAKDEQGFESGWSKTIMKVPRNSIYRSLFDILIEWFTSIEKMFSIMHI